MTPPRMPATTPSRPGTGRRSGASGSAQGAYTHDGGHPAQAGRGAAQAMTQSSREIRVLVVDDNDILGESLRRWMTGEHGVRCVGWTDDLVEALRLAGTLAPDLVLLDVDMPGGDTFALLERLTDRHPAMRIVMLSGHMRHDYIERALDAGAAGYIVKDESPASIIDLVRRAIGGEVVLSATAARRPWAPPGPGRWPVRRPGDDGVLPPTL